MMRCFFIIQGEGRGHWRQAMTLKKWLEAAEHEVVGVAFGESASNPLPASFMAECNVPIFFYDAPTFVKDGSGQSILIGKTILNNLVKTPAFLQSIKALSAAIKAANPDIVFNFYDPIGGICSWRLPKSIKQIALANQFTLTHPNFPKPKGYFFQKRFLSIFNRICAGRATRWAMSWIDLPDTKGLKVLPPILEVFKEVKVLLNHQPINPSTHQPINPSTHQPINPSTHQPINHPILVYMVNYGYGVQVEAWCREHQQQEVLCFWNHPTHKEVYKPLPNVSFEPLNKAKFKAAFDRCNHLVTSAGFQTVTEALVAQKSFAVVPVEGQYEQVANAHFLATHQLASITSFKDLSRFSGFKTNEVQRRYLVSGKEKYLEAIFDL
jgi:Glycosyl transferase family 1